MCGTDIPAGFKLYLRPISCTFSSIPIALKLVALFFVATPADETQPGQKSCPRLHSFAFSSESIMPLSRVASSSS